MNKTKPKPSVYACRCAILWLVLLAIQPAEAMAQDISALRPAPYQWAVAWSPQHLLFYNQLRLEGEYRSKALRSWMIAPLIYHGRNRPSGRFDSPYEIRQWQVRGGGVEVQYRRYLVQYPLLPGQGRFELQSIYGVLGMGLHQIRTSYEVNGWNSGTDQDGLPVLYWGWGRVEDRIGRMDLLAAVGFKISAGGPFRMDVQTGLAWRGANSSTTALSGEPLPARSSTEDYGYTGALGVIRLLIGFELDAGSDR